MQIIVIARHVATCRSSLNTQSTSKNTADYFKSAIVVSVTGFNELLERL